MYNESNLFQLLLSGSFGCIGKSGRSLLAFRRIYPHLSHPYSQHMNADADVNFLSPVRHILVQILTRLTIIKPYVRLTYKPPSLPKTFCELKLPLHK